MNKPEARHRLAAILAADAAGYSRLMTEDDRATLAALDAARSVFRMHIEEQGGRVIDTAGDSVLASFETATGAVGAALAVQRKLSTAAPSFPDAVRLSFRIGVHLGDVLEKADGSVYGDGVNIAAGLQALCKPGSVMISQAVHGAIASRIRNGFDDVGEHAVKNIVHPVRASTSAPTLPKGRSPPHRFGRYAVLPEKRQLLIDGEAAPLDRRAFDLLLALIERRHRVVSRNELADLVWPGRGVENNNLGGHVRALHKLLGPSVIATVPGRGYRFIPALDEDDASSFESMPDSPHSQAASLPEPSVPKPFAPPCAPPTLFGRENDLAALNHLLTKHRHVTVVGAGGIGKSSLALAATHVRHAANRDGAVWVELAQILDPALLASTLAQALGLPVSSGADPLRLLVGALVSTRMLIVLDNAEHLVEAVACLAAAVLARAPDIRLLVTSQVALKVDGERIFRLGALACPETGTTAAKAIGLWRGGVVCRSGAGG